RSAGRRQGRRARRADAAGPGGGDWRAVPGRCPGGERVPRPARADRGAVRPGPGRVRSVVPDRRPVPVVRRRATRVRGAGRRPGEAPWAPHRTGRDPGGTAVVPGGTPGGGGVAGRGRGRAARRVRGRRRGGAVAGVVAVPAG